MLPPPILIPVFSLRSPSTIAFTMVSLPCSLQQTILFGVETALVSSTVPALMPILILLGPCAQVKLSPTLQAHSNLYNFFFKKKKIHFWLHWVFPAAHGLSLVPVSMLYSTGLAAPWHVESSWSRDWTHVSCFGKGILNHWTTREVHF